MSNTVITNYTDLNGPSTKADSSVVVIVNKDGSLSVDQNLLGTLMGKYLTIMNPDIALRVKKTPRFLIRDQNSKCKTINELTNDYQAYTCIIMKLI